MAREKYQTLTEQMYYVLLCLLETHHGVEIMAAVGEMTKGRVSLGPGTLYNLLEDFQKEGLIIEMHKEGRKRFYKTSELGVEALDREHDRLKSLIDDYHRMMTQHKGDDNA